MSARPYSSLAILAEMRSSLTDTERAILRDVWSMRLGLATDLEQLQQLRRPLSTRQFRRTLESLQARRVLFRLSRTVGGTRAGSSGYVYGVGTLGQRLMAASDAEPVKRAWTPRPSWLTHALAVSRLYVHLRQLEAEGGLTLAVFAAEPGSWRIFTGPEGGQTTLKPDAYVRTETSEYIDTCFIEVDMSTESPATLTRKLDVYRRYWMSGQEQERHGVFPQVLWLVPDDARAAVVASVVERQPDGAHALHQVVRYDQARSVFSGRSP